jgi:hypothetical protein
MLSQFSFAKSVDRVVDLGGEHYVDHEKKMAV